MRFTRGLKISPHLSVLNRRLRIALVMSGIAFFMIPISFSSCSQEEPKENFLKGRWTVVSAARNGKITETLEDGYFDFSTDSTFTTNIYSGETTFPFEATDEGFVQLSPDPIQYTIERANTDTLLLSAQIRNYEFLFLALRDSVIMDGMEL